MADVTISGLSPITPSTGLFLPASDNNTTGKVTLSQVCGVMTSAQITTALGYTPYNGATNPNGYVTASSLPASQQLIKAWANFDGNGATGTNQTIRASYNVSSVYKESDGMYMVYFASALQDANYVVSGVNGGRSASYLFNFYGDSHVQTSSNFRCCVVSPGNRLYSSNIIQFMVVR